MIMFMIIVILLKVCFLSKCYENVFLSSDDKQINLATSDTFRCINMLEDNFQVDNVKISIKTDYEVTDNNADSVSGKKFIIGLLIFQIIMKNQLSLQFKRR